MIEQPTVMGMKVGWSQKMVDDFKELLFRPKKLHQLIEDNRILQVIREKQAVIINTQMDEIDRLKSIDKAVRDFIFERSQAERDEFAEEGFEEVVASRPLKEKFKA
jgi:hypothetical protein